MKPPARAAVPSVGWSFAAPQSALGISAPLAFYTYPAKEDEEKQRKILQQREGICV